MNYTYTTIYTWEDTWVSEHLFNYKITSQGYPWSIIKTSLSCRVATKLRCCTVLLQGGVRSVIGLHLWNWQIGSSLGMPFSVESFSLRLRNQWRSVS